VYKILNLIYYEIVLRVHDRQKKNRQATKIEKEKKGEKIKT